MRINFQFLVGLTGIIVIVVFSSCQKEVEAVLPGQPEQDSTTISKIVLLDTTLVPGQDTLFKIAFTYDNQKRKTGEDFTEIDNSTGIRYTFFYRYSYSGTDTLPFKASEKYDFITDSTISYFTYSNRFVVKDSSVGYTSGAVSDIQTSYFSALTGNKFLRELINFDPVTGSSQLLDSTVYSRTVSAGNLLSGVDSTWTVFGPPNLSRVTSFQFTYDNKANPLARLSLWYLGYFENFDDQVYIDMGVNNLLSTKYDELFPSGSTETSLFSYSYNNLGYPSISRASGTDGNKALYFYTKL